LGREKIGRDPKGCKFINTKIRVENNGVELILDAIIYSVWNFEAVWKYISKLTGLKNRKFKVWLDVIEWEDKWSIGTKKASINKSNSNRRKGRI
jgi:hypothetical protein